MRSFRCSTWRRPGSAAGGGLSATLYAAILTIRRAGLTVYAEGRGHRVGGRLLSDRELRRVAARYRREGGDVAP